MTAIMGNATAWLLYNLEQLQIRANQDYDPQNQSPLFNKLPAELRNSIFALAVTEEEDLSRPYDRETYYWRPGFRGPRRFNVTLLRTCKRIWLETRPLPLILLENLPWAFFLTDQNRRPKECQNKGPRQSLRAEQLLTSQWQALKTIQIFIQGITKSNIEGFFQEPLLRPSTIILTVRYTDWLWWETEDPLELDGRQMRWTRLPNSVTKVIMEFEMIQSREQELKNLFAKLCRHEERYRWYRQDRKHLKIMHREDAWAYGKEWKWDGPTKFEGKTFAHHPPGDTMTYIVRSITWSRDKDANP
ncbi:uncharacterized protein BDR25DRAFT_395309 [Lindgomyces ingoldianus]|uniref:Uncharacterized protein n=1 Tax=Lindgomyces ingoldianus TaxID=673940 RepID=A0ACB6QKT8_9PLEO|nr:uncharacterized protein BDR25DRAFT_395309 [Lindgomyces ingoldianus]KAF2467140.1 hypothetical protein BDR25DRAFT_395309 [Lindgomyces ingoldianus]